MSENLLQGSFEGFNTITVKVKEVGDQKQLDFEPSVQEHAPTTELAEAPTT